MLISIIVVTSIATIGIIITWVIISNIRRQIATETYKPKQKKVDKNDK